MFSHYRLCCLFGILACFVSGIVARAAIINGEKGGVDKFPYQVSLLIHNHGNICGGGIIGDEFILTAAHCIVNENLHYHGYPVIVVAGTDNLRRLSEPTVLIPIMKIYIPTEYNPLDINKINDIAVLKLQKPLNMKKNKFLKKLKLPKNKGEHYDGMKAKVAGFGWDWIHGDGSQFHGNNTDERLRFTLVDITSQHQCQREHPSLSISDKHLCGRVKQTDISKPTGVCNGDSGSPLVDEHSMVIGVLSFGPTGCTEKISSALYTRVSHQLTFIHNAMIDKINHNIRVFDLTT